MSADVEGDREESRVVNEPSKIMGENHGVGVECSDLMQHGVGPDVTSGSKKMNGLNQQKRMSKTSMTSASRDESRETESNVLLKSQTAAQGQTHVVVTGDKFHGRLSSARRPNFIQSRSSVVTSSLHGESMREKDEGQLVQRTHQEAVFNLEDAVQHVPGRPPDVATTSKQRVPMSVDVAAAAATMDAEMMVQSSDEESDGSSSGEDEDMHES